MRGCTELHRRADGTHRCDAGAPGAAAASPARTRPPRAWASPDRLSWDSASARTTRMLDRLMSAGQPIPTRSSGAPCTPWTCSPSCAPLLQQPRCTPALLRGLPRGLEGSFWAHRCTHRSGVPPLLVTACPPLLGLLSAHPIPGQESQDPCCPPGERALAQSPLHRRDPRNPVSLGNPGAAGSPGESVSPPPVPPTFLTLIPSGTPQRCELPGLVGAGTPASFLVLCISLVEESGPTLSTSMCDGLRSPASVTSPWLCSGILKAALLRAVLSPHVFVFFPSVF